MDGPLVDGRVVARHEESYKHTDHLYPNENIVRLIKWFLPPPVPGTNVLDYGFGPGENLIHMARLGYEMTGVEVSQEAFSITKRKLEERGYGADLRILTAKDQKLPFPDSSFNAIVCNQTLYFLVTEERITHCLNEFYRVMKPGARLICTMMSRFNSMCTEGIPIGCGAYEHNFKGNLTDAPPEMPNRVYVTWDEAHCRRLFHGFEIKEIGYFDNYYCGMAGHHWVVLAEKAR